MKTLRSNRPAQSRPKVGAKKPFTVSFRMKRDSLETLESMMGLYAFESEDKNVRRVGRVVLNTVRKSLAAMEGEAK